MSTIWTRLDLAALLSSSCVVACGDMEPPQEEDSSDLIKASDGNLAFGEYKLSSTREVGVFSSLTLSARPSGAKKSVVASFSGKTVVRRGRRLVDEEVKGTLVASPHPTRRGVIVHEFVDEQGGTVGKFIL